MTRRAVLNLCLFATALLLTGCFTGERPHFSSDPFGAGTPTGDAAIDAVLAKLDAVTSGPTTAIYAVLTKFGNTTSSATVVLDRGQRAIEVGAIRFLETAGQEFTCAIDPATDAAAGCAGGFDEASISNVGVTIDFYAAEAATRLRRDAQARLADAVASQEVIANQDTTCATVTLTGGTVVYCVLANGMIAKLDDGAVLITLGLLVPTADPAKFVPNT